MTRIVCLLVSCVLLGVCNIAISQERVINDINPHAETSDQQWQLMTGKWYGKQPTKSGGTQEWLTTRLPNGLYKIVFRIYPAGSTEYTEIVEAGEWGIVESIYFTIFKGVIDSGKLHKVDPTNPYNRDVYEVLTLDQKQFVYRSLDSGNEYIQTRVDKDFTLPEPGAD